MLRYFPVDIEIKLLTSLVLTIIGGKLPRGTMKGVMVPIISLMPNCFTMMRWSDFWSAVWENRSMVQGVVFYIGIDASKN